MSRCRLILSLWCWGMGAFNGAAQQVCIADEKGKRTMAERLEGRNVRLFLRLNPDLKEQLRAATRYQGDLSEYITDALVSIDLSTVSLGVLKVSRTDPGLTADLNSCKCCFADGCMEAPVSNYSRWPTQPLEFGWRSGCAAFMHSALAGGISDLGCVFHIFTGLDVPTIGGLSITE